MEKYLNVFFDESRRLDNIISRIKDNLKIAPAGSLRIAHNKGTVQYYNTLKENKKCNIYIRKMRRGLITALAQKDYDVSILETYIKKKECLDVFVERFFSQELNAVGKFNSLSEDRRNLITPYEIDSEEFRRKWESKEYEGKGFEDNAVEIYSEKGERVRSKSEKMIADKLSLLDIPYRYEAPLYLDNGVVVYPDFTLLNVGDRKEVILEHFGMMGNTEYCNSAIWKINQYAKQGFYLGDNFLATFETQAHPIDMVSVSELLRKHLL